MLSCSVQERLWVRQLVLRVRPGDDVNFNFWHLSYTSLPAKPVFPFLGFQGKVATSSQLITVSVAGGFAGGAESRF